MNLAQAIGRMVGFNSLLQRELYRIIALPNQTVIPPLVTATLYMLIFGYAVGSQMPPVRGIPYNFFILPGIVMITTINASYTNPANSIFIARFEHFIQDVLVSPLSYFEMVLAFTLGGVIRGMILGTLTLAVGYFLFGLLPHSWTATLSFMLIGSMAFGSFGCIVGLWSMRWDDMSIYLNYVVTPFVFFGGVFYSIDMLPPLFRTMNLFNPVFYLVNGFRFGLLGVSDADPHICAMVGLSIFGLCFSTSILLFRSGYNLRS